MPTQKQSLKSIAKKGTGGDTELAHVSKGDVVVPIEMQTIPAVSEALRNLFTAAKVDKKKFTVGTGKRNYKTGLQAFALGQPINQQNLLYEAKALGEMPGSLVPTGGGSASSPSGTTLASTRTGILSNANNAQDTPFGGPAISDLVKQMGAGDTAGPGNPAGGQPGSAGFGPAKDVADALVGLVAGQMAPGFGAVNLAAQALTNPNFDLASSLSLGLLGKSGGFPGAITDPGVIGNMSVDPSAYGLANAAVANTGQMTSSESPQQQAAQQAALDAAGGAGSASLGPGGEVGANPGGTPGLGTGDAPGGAPGGVSGGAGSGGGGGPGDSTGGGTGAAGGETAKGGPIKGPPAKPGKDNLQVEETGQGLQAGEYVLNKNAKAALGEKNLKSLNEAARKGDKEAIKESLMKMVMQLMSAKKAA